MIFPASRGCPNSLAYGPFLHLQRALSQSLFPLPHLLFLILTLLPPSYKYHCDYTGPIWIIQHNLSCKIINLISTKFLLPYRVTYSQIVGIKTWTSFGGWERGTLFSLPQLFILQDKTDKYEEVHFIIIWITALSIHNYKWACMHLIILNKTSKHRKQNWLN